MARLGASAGGRTRPGRLPGPVPAANRGRRALGAIRQLLALCPWRARGLWWLHGLCPMSEEGGPLRTRLGLTALGAWLVAMVAVISYTVLVDRVGPIEWTGPKITTTTTIDRPTTTTTTTAAITDGTEAPGPE